MSQVTSATPYVFGTSFRDQQIIVIGVNLNGGTVSTDILVGSTWVNTGDTYASNGAYQLQVGGGGVSLRIVCTGSAVVEVP